MTSRYQQGAVLIVSLVLLIIMTLLGLSSMHNTVMEERMAGNLRNYTLAYQSSEAALRAGEDHVMSFPYGIPLIADNTASSNVYTLDSVDQIHNNHLAWWQEFTPADWNNNLIGSAPALKHLKISGATDQSLDPSTYIIESLTPLPSGGSVSGGLPEDWQDADYYYQITSRGAGIGGRSVIILRSTYKRKY